MSKSANTPAGAPMPFATGRLIEPLYRAAIHRRNRRFDRQVNVTRVPVPVISVGNISVGGTGKSPFVVWLVERLIAIGKHPGIVMRGYKALPNKPSDEEAEFRERLPATPVLVNPDRAAAASSLLRNAGVDCIVADDAFQHRFLGRDLDIVLIDVTRDPFQDRCLPAGWLREPPTSLSRADVIVLTHCESATANSMQRIKRSLSTVAPNATIAQSAHEWTSIRVDQDLHSVGWLADKTVIVVCAIGNPLPFLRQVETSCREIAARVVKRDHHHWGMNDASAIASLCRQNCAILITTGKDMVKLRSVLPEDIFRDAAVPQLAHRLFEGEEAVLQRLSNAVERFQIDPATL